MARIDITRVGQAMWLWEADDGTIGAVEQRGDTFDWPQGQTGCAVIVASTLRLYPESPEVIVCNIDGPLRSRLDPEPPSCVAGTATLSWD